MFDIEADNLLAEATTIHCLVIKDLETGKVMSCSSQHGPDDILSIQSGVEVLEQAETLWAHNGISYDYPLLEKLCRFKKPVRCLDTLRVVRLMFPNIEEKDHLAAKKNKFPARLIGNHSLEAWGYRLGIRKGAYGKTADFSKWAPEMQTYCEQDVDVLEALVRHVMTAGAVNDWGESLALEHDFAWRIEEMCRRGVRFDTVAAADLTATLVTKRDELTKSLQAAFPPKEVRTVSPKKKIEKVKYLPFNPASRQQVAERLIDLGWSPSKTTDAGNVQVDEAILKSLPYPEAHLLAEYYMVNKLLGQVSTGAQAWLKNVRNGRLHGSVNTNGAVTGRCTHSNPNLSQVPGPKKPFGRECRALFGPNGHDGLVQVGADASGLELRCLAHYLARYDNGAYAKIVCEGDVHKVNQKAFGIADKFSEPDSNGKRKDLGREIAKTGIYALIYGAGDWKLGVSLFPQLEDPAKKQQAVFAGQEAKQKFKRAVPAYARLVEAVEAAVQRGYLRGLDGRRLYVRSKHSALNTLLQSAGALLVKKATVLAAPVWDTLGARLILHIHDEVQLEVPAENAEAAGKAFVTALQEAGRIWGFRCPLSGEYKVGNNWAETH